MKDTNLCKCTNCDSILIDGNPQVDAPLYDLKDYPEAKYMEGIVERVGMIGNDDLVDYYWACPECLTDEFLIDNIN